MMPGENHLKAAGIASEAVGSCQKCTSLQQNLNEYVAALITLKQKIIDSDHLLAEYQQKCDDLKNAERENKTIRCQLEQMLQKVSLWEEKEQLKSLTVELEEKTYTLDIVEKSHLEIIRKKKDCKKCDMVKKKHNEKLKKMEAVASKHVKNVKQLQHEKRILERELVKIQKKLLDFQNKKNMKNAQTQVTNDQPVVKLDKKKIRILLQELWGCIETSTENIDADTLMLETSLRKGKNFHSPEDSTPPLSHLSSTSLSCKFETFSELTDIYASNDSSPCKELKNEIHTYNDALKEYTEVEPTHAETSAKDVLVLQDLNNSHLLNSDFESDVEELSQIMNWAKPLPHLLSPLTFSPLSPKCIFGEFTDSSDNESSDNKNKAKDCTTLKNKLTCVQDQNDLSPCSETGNSTENCKKNISHQYESTYIVTDCIKSQSEFCSGYKGDLATIAGMETDKKDVEMTPIQIEISFGVANNTFTTNGLTKQNAAVMESKLQSAVNKADSFEEALILYPNLNNPDNKISSINNNEVKLRNPSSTSTFGYPTTALEHLDGTRGFSGKLDFDSVHCSEENASSSPRCNLSDHRNPSVNAKKRLFTKDSFSHNNNKDMCSNGHESTKSLQVCNIISAGKSVQEDINTAGENRIHEGINLAAEINVHEGINSAGENNHVHKSINRFAENNVHNCENDAEENFVCNNFSVDKNMDDSSLTNIDRGQYNLFPTQPKTCLNESNQKLYNECKNVIDSKAFKSYLEDLDTEKSDYITSVNVEKCSAAKIEQLSIDELQESSSTPIVQFEHTRTINHYTDKMDKVDPKDVQEVSLQKEEISLEQKLTFRNIAEDGHCYKTKSNKLGYDMQESSEFMPASTEHALQRHKSSTKTQLYLDSSTADKENYLSESSAGCDSIRLSLEKLQDVSRGTIHSNLKTVANKMEKTKEDPKHIADESGSTNKSHCVTEHCKESLSEMVQVYSSVANLCKPVSLNAQKAVIDTQVDICAYNITDHQLLDFKNNQSHSTFVLNGKNTFLSNVDTTNADGCLNKLEIKSVFPEKGMPALSNQQFIKVSMDPEVETRDQIDNMYKDLCKDGTPKKQFYAELDSASEQTRTVSTVQLSNDTHSMKFNQPKVMPDFALVGPQHLNIPKSSKLLNKITEETVGNIDACSVSLDSSEDDDFPIRKVSCSKTISNNTVILKKYCKSALESIEKVCNIHLKLNDTPCKPVITDMADIEYAGDLAACGVSKNDSVSLKAENDTPMENNTLGSVDIIVDLDNGKANSKHAVDQYSSEKERETGKLEECERPKEKLASENIPYESNNTEHNFCIPENEAKKTLLGKNFIWNFDRPDDSIYPRLISGKPKLRANVKMLQSGSKKSCNRTAFNIEKRLKLNKVNKDSYQQKLSRGVQNSQNTLVGETVLANADTSNNLDKLPETITKVRAEMGPPLPPLLGPLLATPPKSIHHQSPILSSSSCSSLPSPLDDLISPLQGTPFPQLVSPLPDGRRQKSPVFIAHSPAEKANRRILSSPLQFCAATPKHALAVPGRLPLSASNSSSTSVQENSVKILDTMYPELSARARTLNILKGNVQLNRGLPRDGKNVYVSQITGFKSITSTSTAFIKTGSNSKESSKDNCSNCESRQQPSSISSPSKRTSDAFLMPRSAKRLRLDTESPVIETMKTCLPTPEKDHTEVLKCQESCLNIRYCELLSDVVKDSTIDEDVILKALKKIEELCFDLLPVIRSHIFVGAIPKVPVMRNEEKEVIYEFSTAKKSLADRFLQVVLKKIKTGKRSMATTYLQALCRVYVGLCRQLGDIERARILCYSILKEDFPDPDRLLLFIVSSWNDIISTHGVVSKAIQAVLKNLVKEDVVSCLGAYLNWEKTPPMNATILLSSVLMAIQLCPDGKFQQSEKYGEDLTDGIWEYVFAVDLLCSHRKWVWTHDKIISKELWPLLDKWVKRKKGNPNVSFVSDLIAATVLRLVGHLCLMGLKEGYVTAVKNIGAVIIAFLQHANEEGMSWGVQLACVYMLFDLAPSDPAAIYKTLQAWKESAKIGIPPAVASCMQELESICGLTM